MNKYKLSTLILLSTLIGCNTSTEKPNINNEESQKIVQEIPKANDNLPTNFDKVLQGVFPGSRLVQKNELHKSIRDYPEIQTFVEADFNLDGKKDWAIMYSTDNNNINFTFIMNASTSPEGKHIESGINGEFGPKFMQFKKLGESAMDNAYLQFLDLPDKPYISPESRKKRDEFDKNIRAVPGIYICEGEAGCNLYYFVGKEIRIARVGA